MRTHDHPATDRAEVAELLTRLADLLDGKRWNDIGTVYADDVTLRSPRGELHGLAAITAYLHRGDTEGEHTRHQTTGVLVDLDGSRAAITAQSLVRYFRDGRPPHRSSGLRHKATAVRTPSGWRIKELDRLLLWARQGRGPAVRPGCP